MVVDDDDAFVRHLSKFVEHYCGLAVVETCSNAEAALERVSDCRPLVILLDVYMSGMTGLQAIQPLKAASPHSIIIVVSSMPAEYGQKARELGAHGYVEKGRIYEDLPEVIAIHTHSGATH